MPGCDTRRHSTHPHYQSQKAASYCSHQHAQISYLASLTLSCGLIHFTDVFFTVWVSEQLPLYGWDASLLLWRQRTASPSARDGSEEEMAVFCQRCLCSTSFLLSNMGLSAFVSCWREELCDGSSKEERFLLGRGGDICCSASRLHLVFVPWHGVSPNHRFPP